MIDDHEAAFGKIYLQSVLTPVLISSWSNRSLPEIDCIRAGCNFEFIVYKMSQVVMDCCVWQSQFEDGRCTRLGDFLQHSEHLTYADRDCKDTTGTLSWHHSIAETIARCRHADKHGEVVRHGVES